MKLIVLGKTKEDYLRSAEDEYLKRLQRYVKLEYLELPASKGETKAANCLLQEEKHLLNNIKSQDFVILLDEKGKEQSSRDFSNQLKEWMNHQNNLCFIVGGAFGFSASIKERANAKLSLSKMTFPHQLVRTIFLEQLYRAFTILKGGKYHND